MPADEEITWERLDKRIFYSLGAGVFSGVTVCLYPLSVIKTRQMALPGPGGLEGARQTALTLWRLNGIQAFYKGFGTVVVGTLPARVVYMSALEMTKSTLRSVLSHWKISDITAAGTVNFIAGGTASMCSQFVYVPVDVVSQRLMVLNSPTCKDGVKMNGISMARLILREEGIRGLWRGFSASLVTYVPNSALWWSSYGMWQKVLWHQVDTWRPQGLFGAHAAAQEVDRLPSKADDGEIDKVRLKNEVISVQTASAMLAGATSACFTTPLDVVKTRLQLAKLEDGRQPTMLGTVQDILKTDGIKGFARGMVPRIANVGLWGTAMVSAYEFLKRNSVRAE